MRKIAPIGKRSYAGKKFKSVGPNELSASDKNFVRNNINKYTVQQLGNRVGKGIEVIEKFFKKEKLVQILDIQSANEPSIDEKSQIIEEQVKEKAVLKPKKEPKVKPSKPPKELKVEPIKEPKVKPPKAPKIKPTKEPKIKPTKEPKIKPPKVSKEKLLEKPKIWQRRGPKMSEATARKIDFIKENHQKFHVLVLAKALDLSASAIKYHLKNVGLRARKQGLLPSEEYVEIFNFIKENHKEYTISDLAALFKITESLVMYFIEKINTKPLIKKDVKNESSKVINFLRDNYRTMTAMEMSKVLGIKQNRVRYVCERKGFLRTPEEVSAIRNRFNKIVFTADEEAYMLANHGDITFGDIAKNLNHTRSSIIQFFMRKGMKITKTQQDKLSSQNFKDYYKKIKEKKKIDSLGAN